MISEGDSIHNLFSSRHKQLSKRVYFGYNGNLTTLKNLKKVNSLKLKISQISLKIFKQVKKIIDSCKYNKIKIYLNRANLIRTDPIVIKKSIQLLYDNQKYKVIFTTDSRKNQEEFMPFYEIIKSNKN